jgi:hypothetical protein
MAPRMGADERLVADLPGSSKMYFIEELSEILHVFRDTRERLRSMKNLNIRPIFKIDYEINL